MSFAPGVVIVVYLGNPREKYWGRLAELSQVGVSLRGMDLGMVDGWARELARGEGSSLGLGDVFFPLWRVEKIFLDEDIAQMKSVRSNFLEIVGREVEEYF